MFSYGIAQVLLRYSSCTGGIAPQIRMRGRGVIAHNLAMLRHSNPIARNRGVSLRSSCGGEQHGATKESKDATCRHCTGNWLSCATWSCFNNKWNVAFLCKYSCRSGSAERQCTGKHMRIPPLSGSRESPLFSCFPLEPFFEINPGILCRGSDSSWSLIAMNSA